MTKHIEIVADWQELGGATTMGVLHARPGRRGEEIFSFEYDADWLRLGHRELDPSLRLFGGPQFSNEGNFGLFLDSSPDRWGRVLMRRREALDAKMSGRKEVRLTESDYLLGVHDVVRMGALRFRVNGRFLDDNDAMAAPPIALLRELEHASLNLEQEGASDDPAYGEWLSILMTPGSSLGGARPKANVIDPDGSLWIAKFPSGSDEVDIGAWEYVVHTLAERAGVQVPDAKIERLGSRNRTYLSRRFDRTSQGRVHFASAMTMLGRREGDGLPPGSYLDLAEFLIQQGANTKKDLEQLWLRILFSVCVSNTDDHLRNHGFLLTPVGWTLSPAYDMNPNRFGNGLSLNISETSNAQDVEVLRDVAINFRLSAARVDELIQETKKVIETWVDVANELGISREEQALMAPAFEF